MEMSGTPSSAATTGLRLPQPQSFQITPKFAITPRAEYYYDKDGFITGVAQKLKEFTITGEYRFINNFFTRLEYRGDWSNQAVFERGQITGATKESGHVRDRFGRLLPSTQKLVEDAKMARTVWIRRAIFLFGRNALRSTRTLSQACLQIREQYPLNPSFWRKFRKKPPLCATVHRPPSATVESVLPSLFS
jgi:hypothetical protein